MDSTTERREMKFNLGNIISRSPRLETVIMVEKFIKENSGEFKKTELFNKLPKKMMWGTFNVILQYLWDNNKIGVDKKGFVIYIWNPVAGKLFIDRKRVNNMGVIDKLKEKIRPILKKSKISKAGIFGSYARGDNREDSDVDILIETNKNASLIDLIRLKLILEKALKKKVDLVEYSTIKPSLKDRILKEEVQLL